MQIINTYKCNFRCDHCCFSCGPNKKGYLPFSTLDEFLDKFGGDEFINYCGGETFLHPEWDKQLDLLSYHTGSIRVVTNGTRFITKKKNTTACLDKFLNVVVENFDVNFQLQISNDEFHRDEFYKMFGYQLKEAIDIIKWRIEDNYIQNLVLQEDYRDRQIRQFVPLGRAKENGVYDYDGCCALEEDGSGIELSLDPFGRIYSCCNMRGYLGTVDTPKSIIKDRMNKIVGQESCLSCIYENGLDKKEIKKDKS